MAGGGVALYGADIYSAGTVDLLFDGTGSAYGVYKGKLQYHPPLHRAADAKVKTRKLLSWRARSRISELFPDIPRPLISIDGIPVLERKISSLISQKFCDIVLTVSLPARKIQKHFGEGSKWGVRIGCFVEDTPIGNAGAIFKLDLKEDFLLLNADAVFDVDFNRFVAFHKQHRGLVTLFTHPNSYPYESGLIIADKNGAVEQWLAKEDERPEYYRNRVNA